MASLFELLHHLAAFGLVAALLVQVDLIGEKLTVKSARTLRLAGLTVAFSAGFVMVVGLTRVLYFEQGASYYFHSLPFIAKMSFFAIVALLSIYPTVEFLSWTKSLKEGLAPTITDRKLRTIRSIIRLELGGVVLVIIFAILMAYGIGSRG